MKAKFGHVNIVAADWKQLARFYIDVFGCKLKPPERHLQGDWLDDLTGLDSAHIDGMHLLLPGYETEGPTLEIFEYGNMAPNGNKLINNAGFSHIAFAVEDVDACLALLISKGGSVVGKVVKTEIAGAGNINVVYARDPEGNIIELQRWG